jgi:membrane fusion protein (multidrug efflux system)
VRSPIKGVVGERMVRLGDRIQPTTRLFTIADLSDKVVKVYVPQDEMLKIYKGQKAIITTDVLPDQRFEGWVKRISPIVDATSGTFKITVGVKDPKNRLRPGMFLSVRLIVDAHQHVPLIPKAALIYENERSYFFVVKGDSVRRVALKKGFEDSHKVEVLNPVDDSTLVVIVGQEGLRNGNRVRIVGYKYFPWQGIPPEHQHQTRKSPPHRKGKPRPPVQG